MKIVILDGYTANPGDLSWESILACGETTIYDRTPYDLIVERSQGADIVLTNKTPLDRSILGQLSDVKCICVIATGYNVVDTAFASERGILVCNVPAYSTPSVAQHAFALILSMTNPVALHADDVRSGAWSRAKDFSYQLASLSELDGKTLGIVGFGRIGRQMADIARAFSMKVLVSHTREIPETDGVKAASLEEVFSQSDIVSLHCPQTPENTGFVNAHLLSRMKPTALLINTARGGLIDESALAEALETGIIAGAGLDVLSTEPPAADNPLPRAQNCIITPHLAWGSFESRRRLIDTLAANIKAFQAGTPQNVVNAV